MEIDERLLEQVSGFLNTNEGADIIEKLKSTLNLDSGKGDLSSILGNLNGAKEEPSSPIDNLQISKLIPLVTAISSAKKDNRATNLLHALKPLLSREKAPKIDKAISVMQLMALLPILEEHGFSIKDLLG